MKKGDLILIVSILIVIGAGFLYLNYFRDNGNGANKIAEIFQNEKLLRQIDLNKVSKSVDIILTGKYRNVIRVENGRIRFLEANCPDQVCVKTGWLQNNGDIAVCLPDHAVIKITGKAEDVDIVSY